MSAYVIPYYRDTSTGATMVLCAHKQAISYESASYRGNTPKIDSWKEVKSKIESYELAFFQDGKLKNCKGVGKRFNGMLMPAAGKPCFPGGHRKNGEQAIDTALRELTEELFLENGTVTKSMLKPIQTIEGKYFSLDLHKVCDDPKELIDDVNAKIEVIQLVFENYGKTFEMRMKNLQLKRDEWPFAELKKVEFIPAKEAPAYFETINWDFIFSEFTTFSKWVCAHLEIDDPKAAESMSKALVTHFTKNEPIDWHKKAACLFAKTLTSYSFLT